MPSYKVKLFSQSYNYGCWLASTHMLNQYKVWGEDPPQTSITESVLLWGDHGITFNENWLGPHQGLLLDRATLDAYCSSNRLGMDVFNGRVDEFQNQIKKGPFMIAGKITDVGDHFYVISKVSENKIRLFDPMPQGKGNVLNTTIDALKSANPEAFKWCFWKL